MDGRFRLPKNCKMHVGTPLQAGDSPTNALRLFRTRKRFVRSDLLTPLAEQPTDHQTGRGRLPLVQASAKACAR